MMISDNGLVDSLWQCVTVCTLLVTFGPLITPYYVYWFMFLIGVSILLAEWYLRCVLDSTQYKVEERDTQLNTAIYNLQNEDVHKKKKFKKVAKNMLVVNRFTPRNDCKFPGCSKKVA